MTTNPANPIAALLHSRKFLLLVLDTVVSIVLFFTGRYFNAYSVDVNFLIGALQPVFVMLIYLITSEDNSQRAADAHVQAAQVISATTNARIAPEASRPDA